MSDRRWTTPEDAAARLRRRWDSGEWLASYARGEPFEPVSVPLHGPTASEVAADLDQVRRWVARWERVRRRALPAYRVQNRSVGGRAVGTNHLPARVHVESYAAAWQALKVEPDVTRFDALVATTRADAPRLTEWVMAHPMRALGLAEEWPRLLAAVGWLVDHVGTPVYLRQVDAPGVDTKFLEQHRGVIGELADELVDASTVDQQYSRSDLVSRFRLRAKPSYVRLRCHDSVGLLPDGVSDASLRIEEAARLHPGARHAVVVENEVTYLALPTPEDVVVLLGGGYLASMLAGLEWLHEMRVWYWGDLDTHGFAILDRLRRALPDVRSVLMDRDTLITHRDRWVVEPRPTHAWLDRLTATEQDVYQDLVEDVFGESVRLEQERIAWPHVESALDRALHSTRRCTRPGATDAGNHSADRVGRE